MKEFESFTTKDTKITKKEERIEPFRSLQRLLVRGTDFSPCD